MTLNRIELQNHVIDRVMVHVSDMMRKNVSNSVSKSVPMKIGSEVILYLDDNTYGNSNIRFVTSVEQVVLNTLYGIYNNE